MNTQSKKTEYASRRHVLSLGWKALSLSLGATAILWVERTLAQTTEWKALLRRKPRGGKGEVLSVDGRFVANGKNLRKGSVIKSGAQITSSQKGELLLRLSDNSTMQLKGPVDFSFHIDGKNKGVLSLVRGAALVVVPSRKQYLVEGPTATLGIKGTVFYREVFDGQPKKMNRDINNNPVDVPANAKDYFCLCNGEADYLNAKSATGTVTENANRKPHHSRFLKSEKKAGIIQAKQIINHDDRDIKRLIELQKEPKHRSDWLKI